MILDFIVSVIVVMSMWAIIVVAWGKQQEKYNRRQNDNSRNND